MNIFLAAIIFTFFAVFAPNSHGDRPLLLAQSKTGQAQYLDFKLPIARLQATTAIQKASTPLFVSHFFISTETVLKPALVLLLKQNFSLRNNFVTVHTSPLVFCEILQV